MALKDYDQYEEAWRKAALELLQTDEVIREKFLAQLPPEERIRGLAPEERIRGLAPEEHEAMKKLLH